MSAFKKKEKEKKISRLSIVIPVLDEDGSLEETLDSLSRQVRQYRKILVVADAMAEQVAESIRKDKLTTVIPAPVGGMAAALSAGLSAVESPFVAFMRPGDRVGNVEYYKFCVSYLDKHSDEIDHVTTRTVFRNDLCRKRIPHPTNSVMYWTDEENEQY
ncbi:MAG: glycosyltransferase, partial [Christensenellaceae bacterium]|nr:glycosyltransferase [Christensenellaceae bacterium]